MFHHLVGIRGVVVAVMRGRALFLSEAEKEVSEIVSETFALFFGPDDTEKLSVVF